MDRYTIELLKTMLCRELDEIARQSITSHQDLDIVKDLIESLKNLEEIEMNSMELYPEPGMDMRRYSQRGSNYRMGNSYNYYDGNSYARGEGGNNTGNSRMNEAYAMNRGYSGMGNKEEILKELRRMMQETSDDKVRSAILDCISKMEK